MAQSRGFRDQGAGRWLAPNGIAVSEEFVREVMIDVVSLLAAYDDDVHDIAQTA